MDQKFDVFINYYTQEIQAHDQLNKLMDREVREIKENLQGMKNDLTLIE